MALFSNLVASPESSILRPNSAIIVPLSIQRRQSGQCAEPPLSEAIVCVISLIRLLQATPPPNRISDFPVSAIALSPTSTQLAKDTS